MAETTPIIGRTISRYRILEEVGRGGMATVYRALDTALSREVAVKVLHPHLAGEDESKSRLEREAHAVAKLRHDNILEIYDYSAATGETAESFIVTEFIRGPTLTAFLARQKIGVADVAAMIVHELCAALETAHRAGVIHRDIKPENVMIREGDGRVKLTDFGIAQIIDKERLTATGQLIGSPAYLAPELVEGGRVDFRTDVFSLGIVLYRVATGQLPFQGRNPHEMMKRIVECRFTPPDQHNPTVGRGLARIIARALSRRPEDRFPDMESMRRELAADLASAGIDDPRAELTRYFADPGGWEKAARPRLTAALLVRARKESSRSTRLALLGRALSLSPGDPAAQALLDRLGRSQRRGKVAVVGAAALLIAGSGALVLRSLPRPTPTPPSPLASSAAALAPSSALPAGPVGLTPVATRTAGGGATTPVEPRPRPAPRPALRPPPAAAPGRDVALNIIGPSYADVFVDNAAAPIKWTVGSPIHVGPGPHQLRVQHASFGEERIDLGANDTTTPVRRLQWALATLIVTVDPPGANITAEYGQRKPQLVDAGRPYPISIPRNSSDGMEVVTLTITDPEDRHASDKRTVRVRGGGTFPVSVKLLPR